MIRHKRKRQQQHVIRRARSAQTLQIFRPVLVVEEYVNAIVPLLPNIKNPGFRILPRLSAHCNLFPLRMPLYLRNSHAFLQPKKQKCASVRNLAEHSNFEQ